VHAHASAVYELTKSEFRDARLRLHNPEAFVDDDADTANSGEGSTGGGKVFGCVRVRGLPFSSRDADVRQFFDGLTVRACMRAGYNKCAQAGEILLTKDGSGRPSGEAYTYFCSSATSTVPVH
jgi:hypothetical protein